MPSVPARFGSYPVEREIGRGGMGVVYLARDPNLDRPVAIKVVTPELAEDSDRLRRLRREARTLAQLSHPNIATIYGMEEDPERGRFLLLEWVEGRTLADRIQSGPLDLGKTLGIVLQVAEALAAAHERGVIHRDVKPRNIMITPQGRVKVLDFGLARRQQQPAPVEEMAAAERQERFTSATEGFGTAMGTASYMSPERILGQLEDHRSDVFSFGCVFYECLAGRRAFAGATLFGALAAALSSKPDWSALPAELPDELRDLMVACMRRNPEDRLQQMSEAVAILARARSSDTAEPTGDRARSAVPNNLPRAASSMIGRERETAACEDLLRSSRQLTLVGLGGSGKTRLALRLAERALERDIEGVWWVDLAPVQDPGQVPATAVAALGIRGRDDQAPIETLSSQFGDRAAALILDNCEHVLLAASTLVAALRNQCPGLEILATSRQPLGIEEEQLFEVPALQVPSEDDSSSPALGRCESVALFVERARLADPAFRLAAANVGAVADICRRLDGLPLAIELAAARIQVLSAEEIAARLDHAMKLLMRSKGAVPRHAALRLALQWSYDQLAVAEQAAFRALAVFLGGWDLESAAAVCQLEGDQTLDTITSLVAQSLVVVTRHDKSSRYRYLEPVRQFAMELLEAEPGEKSVARTRHLSWSLGLADEAEAGLRGSDQPAWLVKLASEHPNLIGALDWCDQAADGADQGLRLAGALGQYWYLHGHIVLGWQQMDRALQRDGAGQPSWAKARALWGAGSLATSRGQYERAREILDESLALFRAHGDRLWEGRVLNGLGNVATHVGDPASARALYQLSLQACRETGDLRGAAGATNNLGGLAYAEGDVDGSYRLAGEAAELLRQIGDREALALALSNRVGVSVKLGQFSAARDELTEALELALGINAPWAGLSALFAAAELALNLGDGEGAAWMVGAATSCLEKSGLSYSDSERRETQEIADRARAALGEEGFGRTWATGRSLSFPDAAGHALTWLRSQPKETGSTTST